MQTKKLQIDYDGLERKCLLMLPAAPDGSLLIGLHGATQRGSIMARTTRFHELPSAGGFTLAYPDAWQGVWRDGRAEDDAVDDVGFIETLIERLIADHKVSEKKIFVVGASNGGFLSQRLICDLPGRFRAVATIIATIGLSIFPRSYIDEVPSLYLAAGTADPIIPFTGGETPGSLMHNENAPIIGFDDLVAHWKNLGGFESCRRHERNVRTPDSGSLEIITEVCTAKDRAAQLLQSTVVIGGGHQWYGNAVSRETVRRFGATTTEFRLSADIVRFFHQVLQQESGA